MRKLISILALCLIFNTIYSSESDSTEIKSVSISTIIIEAPSTERKKESLMEFSGISSESIGSSIAERLKESSTVFVKDYGPGSLSTISVRGFGASQTPIFWGNIPIGNPMLGQSDLSLLSPSPNQRLELRNSNRSFGQGGELVFGTNDVNYYRFDLGVYQNMGSFQTSRTGAWVNIPIKQKAALYSAVQYDRSHNDFSYENPNWGGQARTNNDHGEYSILTLKQDLYLQIKSRSVLAVNYWGTLADRQLSPNLSEWQSQRGQFDDVHRLKIESNSKIGNHEFSVFSGYTWQNNLYTDTAINLFAENRSQLASAGASHSWSKGQWSVQSLLRYDYQSGRSSTYTGSTNGFNYNVQAGYSTWFNKVKFLPTIGLKQALLNSEWAPFSPSLDLEFRTYNKFKTSFGLKVDRSFRFPTLNDLYWNPGGDSTLQAESGWGQSAYYTVVWPTSYSYDQEFTSRIELYHRKVDDYIQWTPDQNGLWSAENIASVRAYGLDIDFNYKLRLTSVRQEYRVGYGWHRIGSIDQLGDFNQLIYAPVHQFNFGYQIKYRYLTFNTDLQFVGDRWTTTDNSSLLSQYWLWNVKAEYEIKLGNGHSLSLSLTVNNITNSSYQTIANRGMPGTSVNGGLVYQFKGGGK